MQRPDAAQWDREKEGGPGQGLSEGMGQQVRAESRVTFKLKSLHVKIMISHRKIPTQNLDMLNLR